MDRNVIKGINTYQETFFSTLNEAILNNQKMFAQLHSEHKNAVYMLTSTFYLLKYFFIGGFPEDFTFQTICTYLNQQNYPEETQEFVVHEFKKILNERIEQKKFNIIDRKEIDTHIHTESELNNTVIINNDRILLMKDTLENLVKTEMHRIQSCVQIWRSLRLAGHMYCTNGYQNPLEVMLATGQMCLLHTYAFKRSILTPNNYSSLFHRQNVRQEEFFMHKNQIETIKPGFLTLLSNECNQYAGRLLLDENEENGHIIVTGQSGSGKTVTLLQLAAFHAAMHHRVIAFDSSSSLSVEKLCKHLPEQFVNEHVLFYDIEKYGIPINPFLMYDNSSIHKNSTVLGLLASSASDLSPHQYGTLSAALENLDYSEDIHASDILNAINKQKSAKKLLERFEAVLNAIHRYEQTSISTGNNYSSWDEFIKQHEKTPIIIFSAPLGYSPYRTPLIDILLASLYNYQICHKNQPLDILIDELQKENTSKNSPIEQLISVGRNYNISVLAATQHFNVTKNLKELIGNIQTKIFLHPTSNSISAIQACIGTKKFSIDYFNGMDRGECFIDSTFYSFEMKENKHTVLCGKLAKFSAFYAG